MLAGGVGGIGMCFQMAQVAEEDDTSVTVGSIQIPEKEPMYINLHSNHLPVISRYLLKVFAKISLNYQPTKIYLIEQHLYTLLQGIILITLNK